MPLEAVVPTVMKQLFENLQVVQVVLHVLQVVLLVVQVVLLVVQVYITSRHCTSQAHIDML